MGFRPLISHKWILCGWAFLIFLLLIYAVVGERGAIHLWRLQGEKAKLDEQNFRLQKENNALREKITRLRSDDFYLETIAREELNLVRPGEVIYRFQSPDARESKSGALNAPAGGSRQSTAQKSPR